MTLLAIGYLMLHLLPGLLQGSFGYTPEAVAHYTFVACSLYYSYVCGKRCLARCHDAQLHAMMKPMYPLASNTPTLSE